MSNFISLLDITLCLVNSCFYWVSIARMISLTQHVWAKDEKYSGLCIEKHETSEVNEEVLCGELPFEACY